MQSESKLETLMSYVGREYNDDIKMQIENELHPYKVMVCDMTYFNLELFLVDTIRCVLHNGIIFQLGFN
jgi:hypothetical protein